MDTDVLSVVLARAAENRAIEITFDDGNVSDFEIAFHELDSDNLILEFPEPKIFGGELPTGPQKQE